MHCPDLEVNLAVSASRGIIQLLLRKRQEIAAAPGVEILDMLSVDVLDRGEGGDVEGLARPLPVAVAVDGHERERPSDLGARGRELWLGRGAVAAPRGEEEGQHLRVLLAVRFKVVVAQHGGRAAAVPVAVCHRLTRVQHTLDPRDGPLDELGDGGCRAPTVEGAALVVRCLEVLDRGVCKSGNDARAEVGFVAHNT